VFIASGAEPDIITRLLAGTGPGTFFVPSGLPLEARKRWLAYFQRPSGTIVVNACAVPVLRDEGRSLLAVGVTGSAGDFAAGDVVDIAGPDGTVVARGKTAFASDEIAAIAGKKSDQVVALYPSRKRTEVVHRNDLVLL
jgi:glutamate 5-kinase